MTLDKVFISENRSTNRLFIWCVMFSFIAHGASLRWLPGFQQVQIKIPMPQLMEVRLVPPVVDTPIQPVHQKFVPATHRTVKQYHEAVIEHVIKDNATEANKLISESLPVSVKEDLPVKATASSSQPIPAPALADFAQPQIEAKPDYLNNPKPPYPLAARRLGLEGKVILHVEVLQNGICGGLEIKQSSGYDMLDQAAMKAVRSWRFIPAKRGNELLSAWVDVPVVFRLNTP